MKTELEMLNEKLDLVLAGQLVLFSMVEDDKSKDIWQRDRLHFERVCYELNPTEENLDKIMKRVKGYSKITREELKSYKLKK